MILSPSQIRCRDADNSQKKVCDRQKLRTELGCPCSKGFVQDNGKEVYTKLFKISDKPERRAEQFAGFVNLLPDLQPGSQSATLKVSMTHCRTSTDRYPEVGGPGATSTLMLQFNSVGTGVQLLEGSGDELPIIERATVSTLRSLPRLKAHAVERLEDLYKTITWDIPNGQQAHTPKRRSLRILNVEIAVAAR